MTRRLADEEQGKKGGELTDKDDAGLQLVGEREHGLHQLLGLPKPLVLQRAGLNIDEVGPCLLCQRLQQCRRFQFRNM